MSFFFFFFLAVALAAAFYYAYSVGHTEGYNKATQAAKSSTDTSQASNV